MLKVSLLPSGLNLQSQTVLQSVTSFNCSHRDNFLPWVQVEGGLPAGFPKQQGCRRPGTGLSVPGKVRSCRVVGKSPREQSSQGPSYSARPAVSNCNVPSSEFLYLWQTRAWNPRGRTSPHFGILLSSADSSSLNKELKDLT